MLSAPAAALAIAACGGGAHFKDRPSPATPVDLSVYIDNSHVAISPAHVGAGPVILIVSNLASHGLTLNIESPNGAAVATSGLIDSGQTAQVPANLKTGTYDLAAGSTFPAKLQITKPRPNADNALLEP